MLNQGRLPWAFAPSHVITSSSLGGGISSSWGTFHLVVKEDDVGIKVSTVSLETAARRRIFSHALTKIPGARRGF